MERRGREDEGHEKDISGARVSWIWEMRYEGKRGDGERKETARRGKERNKY